LDSEEPSIFVSDHHSALHTLLSKTISRSFPSGFRKIHPYTAGERRNPRRKKSRFQRPMRIPSRIGRGSWLAPPSGRLEPGGATSRGENESSCREGRPEERKRTAGREKKDGREGRRRTTRRRHQRRLRPHIARPGPATYPAATIPNPNRPVAATPAPARGRHGHAREQGEGCPWGRRRSEEGRRSGAGQAPTGASFIIAVIDSPEVEKATEGGGRRSRESKEEVSVAANQGRRASCSAMGSPAPCQSRGGPYSSSSAAHRRRSTRSMGAAGAREGVSRRETEVRLLPCGSAHSPDPLAAGRICVAADRIEPAPLLRPSKAWRRAEEPSATATAPARRGACSRSVAAAPPAGVGRWEGGGEGEQRAPEGEGARRSRGEGGGERERERERARRE
jgi:hypothetical protein